MDDRCTAMPTPVVRRIALGRLGFTWDRVAGAYRRAEERIDEEALDLMDEDTFGVPGVTAGKFTVSHNCFVIKCLRWSINRCDAASFAVQYGDIPASM